MLGLIGRGQQLDSAILDHMPKLSTPEAHILTRVAKESSMVLAMLSVSLTISRLWWISSLLLRLFTLEASTSKWLL